MVSLTAGGQHLFPSSRWRKNPLPAVIGATEGLPRVGTLVAASRPAAPHLPRAAALPGAPETSWVPAPRAIPRRCERPACGRWTPRAPRKLPPPDPARGLPHARCPPAHSQPCVGRGGARGGARQGEGGSLGGAEGRLGQTRNGAELGAASGGLGGPSGACRGGAGRGRGGGPRGGAPLGERWGRDELGKGRVGAPPGARRGQGARAWRWVSGRWEYRAGGRGVSRAAAPAVGAGGRLCATGRGGALSVGTQCGMRADVLVRSRSRRAPR